MKACLHTILFRIIPCAALHVSTTPPPPSGGAQGTDNTLLVEARRVSQELGYVPEVGLENMTHNDLWGIHDMLLVGFGALFMKNHSDGRQQIQGHADDFVKLLPQLHPYKPCRNQIRHTLNGGGSSLDKITRAALTSWNCLPNKFKVESFNGAFTPDMVDNFLGAYKAKMPSPKNVTNFGACKKTGWPRACSYWVSLHSMAFRADRLGIAKEFLRAIVPMLAGGATLCGGCTQHFRALHEPVLSAEIKSGPCLKTAASTGNVPANCRKFADEITDAISYQNFIIKTWDEPSASAIFVALHNLVTLSIDKRWASARRRLYCLPTILESLPRNYSKDTPKDVDITRNLVGDAGGNLPGLGKHWNFSCTVSPGGGSAKPLL